MTEEDEFSKFFHERINSEETPHQTIDPSYLKEKLTPEQKQKFYEWLRTPETEAEEEK